MIAAGYIWKAFRAIATFFAILVLVGCASLQTPETTTSRCHIDDSTAMFGQDGSIKAFDPCLHIVVANSEGAALAVDGDFRLLEDQNALADRLKSIMGVIRRSSDIKRVLVFVHGGMNSLQDGYDRAKLLTPLMLAAGTYPLFLNWNSDFRDSYFEHLLRVRQGEIARNPIAGEAAIPFLLLNDIGRAAIRSPLVLGSQFQTGWETIPQKWKPYYGYNDSYFRAVVACHTLQYGLLGRWYEDRQNGLKSKIVRVSCPQNDNDDNLTRRVRLGITFPLTLPTKFISSTFIDGLGKSAWRNMLRRTQNMFYRPQDLEFRKITKADIQRERKRSPGADDEQVVRNVINRIAYRFLRPKATPGGGKNWRGRGAFSLMLQALLEIEDSKRLSLVGHSMGTIILNQALRLFPDLKASDVVYMGAAASVRDTAAAVFPYLVTQKEARFYNLSLDSFSEWTETYGLDLAPRGSLLVWIDDFLADPNTRLDQTVGKFNNVMNTINLVPEPIRDRVYVRSFCQATSPDSDKTYKKCASEKFRDDIRLRNICARTMAQKSIDKSKLLLCLNPQRHGDFSGPFPFWIPKLWYPCPRQTTDIFGRSRWDLDLHRIFDGPHCAAQGG